MKLVKPNSPILHKASLPVVWQPGMWDDFLGNMFRVMVKSDGVGLSAVQVGHLYRIFVMVDLVTGKPVYVVNPRVLNHSRKQQVVQEGCLSFPGDLHLVSRPTRVTATYTCGLTGLRKKRTLSGMMARVFLHEMDHLMGITFDEPSAY